jgi:hypothetical protein
MRESDTYQAILEEGAIAEAQKIIVRHGTMRFGPPSPEVRTAILALEDLGRLERMSDRVWESAGWDDVLRTP